MRLISIVWRNAKRAKIDVAYDVAFGYPTVIDIDFIAQAVDDEIGYMISGFAALP